MVLRNELSRLCSRKSSLQVRCTGLSGIQPGPATGRAAAAAASLKGRARHQHIRRAAAAECMQ